VFEGDCGDWRVVIVIGDTGDTDVLAIQVIANVCVGSESDRNWKEIEQKTFHVESRNQVNHNLVQVQKSQFPPPNLSAAILFSISIVALSFSFIAENRSVFSSAFFCASEALNCSFREVAAFRAAILECKPGTLDSGNRTEF